MSWAEPGAGSGLPGVWYAAFSGRALCGLVNAAKPDARERAEGWRAEGFQVWVYEDGSPVHPLPLGAA